MAKYSIENTSLCAIGNAIREKTKDAQPIPLEDMPNKIGDVYEEGKQAEYERFWDAYQQNGERGNYAYSFAGGAWTDETYNPKYPILFTVRSANAYQNTAITDTKVPIVVNATGEQQAFYLAQSLKTIREYVLLVDVEVSTAAFRNCTALKNLTVSGDGKFISNIDLQYSPLSKESIISVINALSDTVSGKTLTLKESAVEDAFGIDINDPDTYTEEFIAIQTLKPNWSISVV